jgi:glycosyltransferase involved in cell wall biosynthesis
MNHSGLKNNYKGMRQLEHNQNYSGNLLEREIPRMKNKKVIYFLSHPIQYFSPLLKALSKEIDIEVYYFSDASVRGSIDKEFGEKVKWDLPMLEGYKYKFLKNYVRYKGLNNRFFDVFNPGVFAAISNAKADIVIVNGWTYSSNWMAIVYAKILGRKVWLRGENPLNQELQKSRGVLFIKKIILKHFLFRWLVDKCLFIGTQSKAFFEYYGVTHDRLLYTPYAVDNNFFQDAWSNYKDKLPQIKQELGLPLNKKMVVFSGKYIPKKRPLDLLSAFSKMDSEQYYLVMVGNGELRSQMECIIQDKKMNNVLLTGFINQSEIPKYYAIADVFVMCSGMGETWGLSVNEAMNFSKPVIVSDTTGCSDDLVIHGKNGFVYPEGNIEQLKNCLERSLQDDVFRMRAGKESFMLVQRFSISKIVEQLKNAIT